MLSVVTAATAAPVLFADIQDQIRGIDRSASDNPHVDSLIWTATDLVERFAGRALMPQTWDLFADSVPDSQSIEIPRAPLQSITDIKTTDANEVTTVFSAASYVVDTSSEPGRVVLKSGISWPSTTLKVANGFVIRFVAGYASREAIPYSIKVAIARTVDALYSTRKTKKDEAALMVLPDDVKAILMPYKLFRV